MRNYIEKIIVALALSAAIGTAYSAGTESLQTKVALTLERDGMQQELNQLRQDALRIDRTKNNRTGEFRSIQNKIKRLEAEQQFINELLNRFDAIDCRLSAIEAKLGIKQ